MSSDQDNDADTPAATVPETKERKKGGALRLFLILFVTLFVGVALAGGIAAGLFYYGKQQFEMAGPAAMGDAPETVYTLPRGYGLIRIANSLHAEGLISDPIIFRLGVMYYRADAELKAGEYAIPSAASMQDIMEILRDGKSILYRLTVPEGLTSVQVLRLVAADPVLIGDAPEPPPEGAILPETYLFQRGTSRPELVEQMKRDHDRVLDQLWAGRAADLPFSTKDEAVIIASIVEKETGLAEERPRVAAVFINRLRRGMRLESDPTIIYGLTGGEPLGRGLRQSELAKITPYNTYEIDGLPPTPIANPGRDAMAAVLNPPDTKELFFVADGTGGHVFAKTYREHRQNVAQWRRVERQRRQESGN